MEKMDEQFEEIWKGPATLDIPNYKHHYIKLLFQQWLLSPGVSQSLCDEVKSIKDGTSKYLNTRNSMDMSEGDLNSMSFNIDSIVKMHEATMGDGSPPRSPSPFSGHKTPRSMRDAREMINSSQRERNQSAKKVCLKEVISKVAESPTADEKEMGNKYDLIPKFYFPKGIPDRLVDTKHKKLVIEAVQSIFKKSKSGFISKDEFPTLMEAIGLPLYFKAPLFTLISMGSDRISLPAFLRVWKLMNEHCHDDAARIVHILSGGKRSYLLREDFKVLLQDVVDTHPGLCFLASHQEFHSRYIQTVIGRIYFVVNRSWSGRITTQEVRRSRLLENIKLLEIEDDINKLTEFFSYEHFYVIYCKFWELDSDHNLFISKEELLRYSDQALSSRIVDRIFSCCVKKSENEEKQTDTMSYDDFITFVLAEEDKKHPASIEYWFRCMDLDGDGAITVYEIEHFYEEQKSRLEEVGAEIASLTDLICQMLDLVKPREPYTIRLSDLKRCKLGYIFFNVFFNLDKYLEYEQKDPTGKEPDEVEELSDWEKFANLHYEALIADENGNNEAIESTDIESAKTT